MKKIVRIIKGPMFDGRCEFKTVEIINARVFLVLMVIFTLVGCATTGSLTVPQKGSSDLLNFLIDGKTTRADVVMTLGQPSGRFEKDKILTYRLGFESKNNCYYLVEREVPTNANWSTWRQAKYSLVLMFDEYGVLLKHSLVEVN
ncbi:MAG: hypothetical protein JXB18_14320 [Sedimentisphaerales bacterium]|nr:hypothetical protein [Sedimentisphaerales bacterium]